jgi:hypothetical protein
MEFMSFLQSILFPSNVYAILFVLESAISHILYEPLGAKITCTVTIIPDNYQPVSNSAKPITDGDDDPVKSVTLFALSA